MMKVKVTVKTTSKELDKLNTLVGAECDVNTTWRDFFKASCKIDVNPQKYLVKSGGKTHVSVDHKIRELIGQFKKVRQFYRVDVVASKGQVKIPVPVPQKSNVNGHPTSGASKKANNANKEQKKGALKKEVSPIRSFGSQRTTILRGGENQKTRVPSTPVTPPPPVKSNNKGKKRPVQNGPQRESAVPVRKARVDEGEITFAPGRQGAQHERVNVNNMREEDDDDMRSQCTAASQESQDDLDDLGITVEDLKPIIVNRLIRNVSNIEINRIKVELKNIMEQGKWSRCSSRMPRAANFLTELFRVA